MEGGVILVVVFLVLCLFKAPVCVSLLCSTLVTALYEGVSLIVLAKEFWNELNSFTLLAVPLFMLAGSVMEAGNITKRIADFADALVGHIKGSLGHVVIMVNMLLAGVSGSGTADAVAVGSMFIPTMKKAGYPDELTAAINAASATMGPIIPPSIIMVVYAASAGVSTGALFLAGLIPGIIVGLTQMLIVYSYAKRYNLRSEHGRLPAKVVLKTFISCLPAMLVPVIIIVGITAGIFTATEAAMIAALYCILISLFLYRSIKPKDLFGIFKKSAIAAAPSLFCIGSAGAFGWMLAYLGIPTKLTQAILPYATSPRMVMLIFVCIFILVGMFMDPLPAIIIFYPFVSALTAAVSIPPLESAIVVCLVLCFGLMTPPYGLTLLLSSQLAGVRSLKTVRVLFPFYIVFIAIVAVIIFFPQVALFVPKLLMPNAF